MPDSFRESLEEHIARERELTRGDDKAIAHKLTVDVFSRMRQLRDQMAFALAYFGHKNVFGDNVSSTTAHAATKYAAAMIELKARWKSKPTVGQTPLAFPSTIARHFLEQLVPLS